MSGRLVILRHKSWHVWNQDNREKVLKDERIQREKEEELESKKRKLLQEKQREVLLNNNSAGSNSSQPISDTDVDRFCLFDDPEGVRLAQRENEEYKKEKMEKERNIRKKEGVADWSLSEGNTAVPWYSKPPTLSSSSSSSSAKMTSNNDTGLNRRKGVISDMYNTSLDPATTFMTPYTAPISTTSQDKVVSSPQNDTAYPDENESSGKQSKKEKKEKKDKKAKKDKKKDKEKNNESHKDEPVLASASTPADSTERGDQARVFEELRQRRLERERVERHRAAMMLAERDIYGSSRTALAGQIQADSRGHSYNQRYNPALSRN